MAEDKTVTKEEAVETAETPAVEAPKKKRKARRNVPQGNVYVLATFNNTIITITDPKGNVLSTASAGGAGFRGSKKGTAYAAQVAAEKAITNAKQNYGVDKVDVIVRGIGLGRDAAVRTLINQRLQVESIKDATGVPHGGVRPRKAKRN
jgi:small subunit ribosomal protein S11